MIGTNIRTYRTKRGLTQGALARSAGLAQSTLADIERGWRTPSLGKLQAIAQALHLPASVLLHGQSGGDNYILTISEIAGELNLADQERVAHYVSTLYAAQRYFEELASARHDQGLAAP